MKYQTYAARVRKMNPIDDDFLRKMAEDKSFCEEVIQTILEEPTLTVTDVKSQDSACKRLNLTEEEFLEEVTKYGIC